MSFEDGVKAGYLAAIIEGEGSIMISRHERKRYAQYTVGISIANDSLELLKRVRDMLGCGSILSHQDFHKSKPITRYALLIGKLDEVLEILYEVQPYLISEKKKFLCEIIIEFCESRLSRLKIQKTHCPYNEREIELFNIAREVNGKAKD